VNQETRHWDGTAWTSYPTASARNSAKLAGTSSGTIYYCGGYGAIASFQGDHWQLEAPSPIQQHLGDAWVESANSLWIVGDYGTIRHWDGVRWTDEVSGTLAPLYAVAGTGPNDLWAAGEGGTILHRTAQGWQSVPSGIDLTIYDLWVGSDGVAIAVAGEFQSGAVIYSGTVLRWKNTSWQADTTPNVAALTGVWGSAPNDVWAVGQQTAMHWDGSTWSEKPVSTMGFTFRGVWGRSSQEVWAVGDAGTIFEWNGSVWTAQSVPGKPGLIGVGGNADAVWAVGVDGAILRHDVR
jgi:hypothetical protein